MTSPDQPAPGEDIAKGKDGHTIPGAGGGQPGDPDPRDPTEDASDPTGDHTEDASDPTENASDPTGTLGNGETPEPLEPPD